jgi:alpha-ketoglutarate-dependent taurine dioxygenase
MTMPKPGLPPMRRKTVSVSETELVKSRPYFADKSLPLLVEPAAEGVDIFEWAAANRGWIEDNVLKYGALLFRGFGLSAIPQFEKFIDVVGGGALEYKYRASPRHAVGENVYTSTDYPQDQSIFPHNEHSFSPIFPMRLFFFCVTEPGGGGETPIGDCRRIFERIPAAISDKFRQKGIRYVRNYNDGFGLPWQTVFQTEDKAYVKEFCDQYGIHFEWKDGDRLRTSQSGPAVVTHPRTGEPVWFNHATFFHVSTLSPELRGGVLATFAEEDLPTNTYFGDGERIPDDVVEQLREIYTSEMVAFPWRQGDVLMLDNMLAVHGRRPYTPPRKIVVGMAEATTWDGIEIN